MWRLSKKSYSCPILYLRMIRAYWQRLHQRFKIVPYQTTKLLYLKKKENEDNNRDKRILSIEEMYDTILRVHIEHNHVRRDGLHKRLSEEYHGVTEKACVLFLANCEECHLERNRVEEIGLTTNDLTDFFAFRR